MTLCQSRVSRGHLTVVPKGVRKAVGIGAGDVLEWEVLDGRVTIRKRKRRTIADVVGMIAHGGDAVQSKREAQGSTRRVR
jgi:bifunctional DNA-binding transcriptional regulator/antitoxin component of YhaV-PrlF toxin-antitoxin module